MKLRLVIAAAVAIGSIFVGAAPASATCRPERPQTCEIEDPPRPEFDCYVTLTLPDQTITINYCDPSEHIPQ